MDSVVSDTIWAVSSKRRSCNFWLKRDDVTMVNDQATPHPSDCHPPLQSQHSYRSMPLGIYHDTMHYYAHWGRDEVLKRPKYTSSTCGKWGSFEVVPVDVIDEILQEYLEYQDILLLSCVNRSWCTFLSKDAYWKKHFEIRNFHYLCHSDPVFGRGISFDNQAVPILGNCYKTQFLMCEQRRLDLLKTIETSVNHMFTTESYAYLDLRHAVKSYSCDSDLIRLLEESACSILTLAILDAIIQLPFSQRSLKVRQSCLRRLYEIATQATDTDIFSMEWWQFGYRTPQGLRTRDTRVTRQCKIKDLAAYLISVLLIDIAMCSSDKTSAATRALLPDVYGDAMQIWDMMQDFYVLSKPHISRVIISISRPDVMRAISVEGVSGNTTLTNGSSSLDSRYRAAYYGLTGCAA